METHQTRCSVLKLVTSSAGICEAAVGLDLDCYRTIHCYSSNFAGSKKPHPFLGGKEGRPGFAAKLHQSSKLYFQDGKQRGETL